MLYSINTAIKLNVIFDELFRRVLNVLYSIIWTSIHHGIILIMNTLAVIILFSFYSTVHWQTMLKGVLWHWRTRCMKSNFYQHQYPLDLGCFSQNNYASSSLNSNPISNRSKAVTTCIWTVFEILELSFFRWTCCMELAFIYHSTAKFIFFLKAAMLSGMY